MTGRRTVRVSPRTVRRVLDEFQPIALCSRESWEDLFSVCRTKMM